MADKRIRKGEAGMVTAHDWGQHAANRQGGRSWPRDEIAAVFIDIPMSYRKPGRVWPGQCYFIMIERVNKYAPPLFSRNQPAADPQQLLELLKNAIMRGADDKDAESWSCIPSSGTIAIRLRNLTKVSCEFYALESNAS
ncbi:hypothetical protein [Aurantimonas sp. 22II-16-19i]|uniref:hypothetical protein n=1 Tax=Aurantimonas sp. 22II-16-19i TaxID=1317114 RepID=UPI00111C0D4F|nr:hypothetical protein [Aurantimonas sp. 22II-16-19i]